MADHPLRPATHLRLGEPLPHQLPNGPRAHPQAPELFPQRPTSPGAHPVLAPLSRGYPRPGGRLLTCYSPVRRSPRAETRFALDLHVLSTPPTFVLSQDQTRQLMASQQMTRKPPTTSSSGKRHTPAAKHRHVPFVTPTCGIHDDHALQHSRRVRSPSNHPARRRDDSRLALSEAQPKPCSLSASLYPVFKEPPVRRYEASGVSRRASDSAFGPSANPRPC